MRRREADPSQATRGHPAPRRGAPSARASAQPSGGSALQAGGKCTQDHQLYTHLYVAGIPTACKHQEVYYHFEQYGAVFFISKLPAASAACRVQSYRVDFRRWEAATLAHQSKAVIASCNHAGLALYTTHLCAKIDDPVFTEYTDRHWEAILSGTAVLIDSTSKKGSAGAGAAVVNTSSAGRTLFDGMIDGCTMEGATSRVGNSSTLTPEADASVPMEDGLCAKVTARLDAGVRHQPAKVAPTKLALENMEHACQVMWPVNAHPGSGVQGFYGTMMAATKAHELLETAGLKVDPIRTVSRSELVNMESKSSASRPVHQRATRTLLLELSASCSNSELTQIFEDFNGTVARQWTMQCAERGKRKPLGVVKFTSVAAAINAHTALHGKRVLGMILNITFAETSSPSKTLWVSQATKALADSDYTDLFLPTRTRIENKGSLGAHVTFDALDGAMAAYSTIARGVTGHGGPLPEGTVAIYYDADPEVSLKQKGVKTAHGSASSSWSTPELRDSGTDGVSPQVSLKSREGHLARKGAARHQRVPSTSSEGRYDEGATKWSQGKDRHDWTTQACRDHVPRSPSVERRIGERPADFVRDRDRDGTHRIRDGNGLPLRSARDGGGGVISDRHPRDMDRDRDSSLLRDRRESSTSVPRSRDGGISRESAGSRDRDTLPGGIDRARKFSASGRDDALWGRRDSPAIQQRNQPFRETVARGRAPESEAARGHPAMVPRRSHDRDSGLRVYNPVQGAPYQREPVSPTLRAVSKWPEHNVEPLRQWRGDEQGHVRDGDRSLSADGRRPTLRGDEWERAGMSSRQEYPPLDNAPYDRDRQPYADGRLKDSRSLDSISRGGDRSLHYRTEIPPPPPPHRGNSPPRERPSDRVSRGDDRGMTDVYSSSGDAKRGWVGDGHGEHEAARGSGKRQRSYSANDSLDNRATPNDMNGGGGERRVANVGTPAHDGVIGHRQCQLSLKSAMVDVVLQPICGNKGLLKLLPPRPQFHFRKRLRLPDMQETLNAIGSQLEDVCTILSVTSTGHSLRLVQDAFTGYLLQKDAALVLEDKGWTYFFVPPSIDGVAGALLRRFAVPVEAYTTPLFVAPILVVGRFELKDR